ncbi:MAG: energy-coupling factor transporter ATPase [Clostridiaceae bacterium]|nr:energy-coupling factor transporter ATPase [Clostridiaceae bacterium]
MIRAENLCFGYTRDKQILKNISFHIKKGEFVAIIGQNGSGKTTLLKHFNGLLKPTDGKIYINGLDVSKHKTSTLAHHVGFLFQNPDHQIFCSTVRQEVAFGLKNLKIPGREIDRRVQEAVQKVGLEEYMEANPFSLSKGQRQRVALASILALDVDIIVLDEPTTGQDYKESIQIMNMIGDLNRMGKTIVMVTHNMELVASYASRVIILSEGSILGDGMPAEVYSNQQVLRKAKLSPPQIFSLAQRFSKKGLFRNVMTPEQMFQEILYMIEGEKNACIG